MQKSLWKKIFIFFDKKEDKVRGYLSKRPILYAFIAGVAIVLFWRGVWMTADMFSFLSGPVSIFISVIVMLMSGVFVSYFVGDVIIISGLTKDKKIIEKSAEEIIKEEEVIDRIEEKLDFLDSKLEKHLKDDLVHLEKDHRNNKN